jgi:hypothetical protein
MGIGLQHGQGHSAWIEACIVEMEMQHENGNGHWQDMEIILLDRRRQLTTLLSVVLGEESAEINEI